MAATIKDKPCILILGATGSGKTLATSRLLTSNELASHFGYVLKDAPVLFLVDVINSSAPYQMENIKAMKQSNPNISFVPTTLCNNMENVMKLVYHSLFCINDGGDGDVFEDSDESSSDESEDDCDFDDLVSKFVSNLNLPFELDSHHMPLNKCLGFAVCKKMCSRLVKECKTTGTSESSKRKQALLGLKSANARNWAANRANSETSPIIVFDDIQKLLSGGKSIILQNFLTNLRRHMGITCLFNSQDLVKGDSARVGSQLTHVISPPGQLKAHKATFKRYNWYDSERHDPYLTQDLNKYIISNLREHTVTPLTIAIHPASKRNVEEKGNKSAKKARV